MVMPIEKDPLALTDYDRTIIGKAATRIELPIITADQGDAFAPSDWKEMFDFIRGWCGACEFEVQRDQSARDKASRVIDETRHLNRKLRALRARAHQAAADRRAEQAGERRAPAPVMRFGVERKAS